MTTTSSMCASSSTHDVPLTHCRHSQVCKYAHPRSWCLFVCSLVPTAQRATSRARSRWTCASPSGAMHGATHGTCWPRTASLSNSGSQRYSPSQNVGQAMPCGGYLCVAA